MESSDLNKNIQRSSSTKQQILNKQIIIETTTSMDHYLVIRMIKLD